MSKVSITRAMTVAKSLDDRIEKAIANLQLIGLTIGDQKSPVTKKYKTADEQAKDIQAEFQQVNDLIARRAQLKFAIQKANLETNVTVRGTVMTLAEAVYLRQSLGLKDCKVRGNRRTLLTKLEQRLSLATREYENAEFAVNQQIENQQNALASNGQQVKQEQLELVAKNLKSMYQPALLDPLNLREVVKNYTDEQVELETTLDFVLSEANTSTQIEIPDELLKFN
jgi:hypothetical protein